MFNYICANNIYWNGYYGSFLGEYKPRSKNIQAPLELSLIEALYLSKNYSLNVIKGTTILTIDELEEIGRHFVRRFTELYAVYEDLRKRGFIVRRGLKFGCDYLVYRYGPGIDHAPYGVQVYAGNEELDPIELVRMGRLLHSVRKRLIIAIYLKTNCIKYYILNWWKP
ncbi:MAG: tRNA-intron lyase [Desulfurococcaceae archaeon]